MEPLSPGRPTAASTAPAVVKTSAGMPLKTTLNVPSSPSSDEQISLPQLIGRGPLEAADLVRVRPRRHLLQLVAGLVQHPRHGAGAGRQGRAACQHVADALAAPGG